MQVETAYDILFMQSMKSRLSGKVNVSQSVRFADVARRKPAKQVLWEFLCLIAQCKSQETINAMPAMHMAPIHCCLYMTVPTILKLPHPV
jgi:hypothetical protein